MFTSQKKVRLIATQGPAQLLNVLAILKYQKDFENSSSCEDHLVIGGLAISSKKRTHLIVKVCTEIASLWDFQSITYLDIEGLRQSSNFRFSGLVHQARLKTNISKVDVLYLCRNWQLFNEVLLDAYTDCEKICYGDGFGYLDLVNAQYQKKPFNPREYAKINSAYLFIPVEGGNGRQFDLVEQVVQPPINYLIGTITEAASATYDYNRQYFETLQSLSESGFTLVLTSNWSESGIMKNEASHSKHKLKLFIKKCITKFNAVIEHKILARILKAYVPSDLRRKASLEVSMYFEQIRTCCSKEDIFLIKSHPRETLDQSISLCELLSRSGYQAFIIPFEISGYSVELLANWLQLKKVIGMHSSACFTLPLVADLEPGDLYPFIDKHILEEYTSERLRPSDTDIKVAERLITRVFQIRGLVETSIKF